MAWGVCYKHNTSPPRGNWWCQQNQFWTLNWGPFCWLSQWILLRRRGFCRCCRGTRRERKMALFRCPWRRLRRPWTHESEKRNDFCRKWQKGLLGFSEWSLEFAKKEQWRGDLVNGGGVGNRGKIVNWWRSLFLQRTVFSYFLFLLSRFWRAQE